MARSFQGFSEVFLSSTDLSLDISRAVRRREVRKLHGRLFPHTAVSHRTALEMRPTARGTVFLSGRYDRTVELPGLRVRQIKGPGHLEGDMPFVQTLHIASRARAYLEVLKARTVRGTASPSLPRVQVEER